jgi:transketolase
MRSVFADAILEQAEQKNIVLVTGDLGYGVFEKLQEKFPTNFLNAGITEQSMTSLAAGLSDEGWLPVVYSIANFPTLRNFEQIRNDIAYPSRHVVICSVGAGLSYASLGSSHFALEDLAVIRSLPNMRILSPSDTLRAKLATISALETRLPTYLRLGKSGEKNFGHLDQWKHLSFRQVSIGSNDFSVFSTGSIGLEVASAISNMHKRVTHYSIEELGEVEDELVEVVSTVRTIVTVEEHGQVGGLFSWVSEFSQLRGLKVRVVPLSTNSRNLKKAGNHGFMREQAGLSVNAIQATILNYS